MAESRFRVGVGEECLDTSGGGVAGFVVCGGDVRCVRMFRDAIVAELERRGWTQYRLVQESGVSKTAVYEYLAGRRDISAGKLERICTALGLALKRSPSRT